MVLMKARESCGSGGGPLTEIETELELAERLRITPRTAITWRQQGILPFFKIGRAIRYRRADVNRILEERYRRGAA